MIYTQRKRRIRLVYLLTCLVFFSFLGTSFVQILTAYREEQDSLYATTLQLNQESAQKLSITMNTLFHSMKDSLRVAPEHLAGFEFSDERLQNELNFFLIRTNNYFNSTIIVNANGTVQASSPPSLELAGQALSTTASKQALELRIPTISPPFRFSTNRLAVLITYPIFTVSGDYMGYLGGMVHLDEPNGLRDIFGAKTINESGTYVYIVDREGSLVFHPDPSRLGENVSSNPVVQKLMHGMHGQEEVINTRKTPFLAGYWNSSENGWGIVVQTPTSKVEKDSLRLVTSVLLHSLPLIIAILAMTIWLANKLSAPFSSLTQTAEALLNGNRVTEFPEVSHWNHEAYHLHKTIQLTIETLQKEAERFSNEAQTDPLTGLANRRTVDRLMAQWTEENQPFSVIVVDMDHFKIVNDSYGHQVGDDTLKLLADAMLAETRPEDYCCRYGGEEFIVLLPHVSNQDAYETAERIRCRMENQDNLTGQAVTISLGVASYPADATTTQAVLHAADQALYAAKRNGRNRAIAYHATLE